MPSKRKKNEAREEKKEGGEKAKSKSQLSVWGEIEVNILHLDQTAAKCTTCKWPYGKC